MNFVMRRNFLIGHNGSLRINSIWIKINASSGIYELATAVFSILAEWICCIRDIIKFVLGPYISSNRTKNMTISLFSLAFNTFRPTRFHLSAITYKLKKYLKFVQKCTKSSAVQLAFKVFLKSIVQDLFSALQRHRKLTFQILISQEKSPLKRLIITRFF